MVECLPRMHKGLGSVVSTGGKNGQSINTMKGKVFRIT